MVIVLNRHDWAERVLKETATVCTNAKADEQGAREFKQTL